MTISTYTELKTEVADFAHTTDLTSKMDVFCLLAEAVINKDLKTLEMEKRLSISLDDAFYDLPADYMAIRALHIEVNGGRLPIALLSPPVLDLRYSNTSGTIGGFAIHGGQIEVRPAPDATAPVTAELSYFARVPTLTGTSTNDILTNYPMIYLSAMMIQVYLYLQDTEQMATWTAAYSSQITQANKTSQGGRYLLPQVAIA